MNKFAGVIIGLIIILGIICGLVGMQEVEPTPTPEVTPQDIQNYRDDAGYVATWAIKPIAPSFTRRLICV
jgi:hypothetical protein